MGVIDVNSRVRKHRSALCRAGLRPVRIWVTDTRQPDFTVECRRQSRLAAVADRSDTRLHRTMEQAVMDIGGWTS